MGGVASAFGVRSPPATPDQSVGMKSVEEVTLDFERHDSELVDFYEPQIGELEVWDDGEREEREGHEGVVVGAAEGSRCGEEEFLLGDDGGGGLVGHQAGDGEGEEGENLAILDDALAATGLSDGTSSDHHVLVARADDGEVVGVVADGARQRAPCEAKAL